MISLHNINNMIIHNKSNRKDSRSSMVLANLHSEIEKYVQICD